MSDALMHSMQRLETAGIVLAMRGAHAQLLRNDSLAAWKTGAVVWEPSDMALYLRADEKGRQIMRTLKEIR